MKLSPCHIIKTFSAGCLCTSAYLIFFQLTAPAYAGINEGKNAFSNGDYGTAYKELKPIADAGDSDAQLILCFMHHDGLGNIPKDKPLAFSYCSESARQDNLWGQYMIGLAYLDGEGVLQDYDLALKWIELAASRGLDTAQHTLGQLYLTGRGVHENWAKGIEWIKRSAAQGNKLAEYDLAGLVDTNASEFSANTTNDLRTNAETGYSGYQLILGLLYKIGAPDYPRDEMKALKWLTRAARQGDALAQAELGEIYLRKESKVRNLVQAHMWLNLAVFQGEFQARKLRDEAEHLMTSKQISLAQKKAHEFEAVKEQIEAFP